MKGFEDGLMSRIESNIPIGFSKRGWLVMSDYRVKTVPVVEDRHYSQVINFDMVDSSISFLKLSP